MNCRQWTTCLSMRRSKRVRYSAVDDCTGGVDDFRSVGNRVISSWVRSGDDVFIVCDVEVTATEVGLRRQEMISDCMSIS